MAQRQKEIVYQETKSPAELEAERKLAKYKLDQTRKGVQINLNEEMDKYIQMLEEKGPLHPLVVLNSQLLEVQIAMRELTLSMCDIAEMMMAIDGMINLMDGALETIMGFFTSSRKFTGGDIRQLKKNVKIFKKSFKNRIKAVRISVSSMSGLGVTVNTMLKKLTKGGMGIRMPKQKKGRPVGETLSPAALEHVNARRKETGKGAGDGSTGEAKGGSGGSGGGTPAGGLPGDLPL